MSANNMILKDSTVVVTGGNGSFGKELEKRLKDLEVAEVRIFSRSAEGLWRGDIRDITALSKVMEGADYVIHAAALKDLHYCEANPVEAINVNLYGSLNVFNAAKAAGIKRVTFISTDKASIPMGVMGYTKALMERAMMEECLKEQSPMVTIVRFGNLMGSRGTVIPLFIRQIKEGKELTITNPQMTRFMMTLSDAVDLTLFALEHGENGSLIVEKAKSVSLEVLAESLFALYGRTGIKVIGERQGENLYETMATQKEMSVALELSMKGRSYLHIPINGLNPTTWAKEFNSHNSQSYSVGELSQIIQSVVNSIQIQ